MQVITVGGLKFHYFKPFRQMAVDGGRKKIFLYSVKSLQFFEFMAIEGDNLS